jgi:hypothetical protein
MSKLLVPAISGGTGNGPSYAESDDSEPFHENSLLKNNPLTLAVVVAFSGTTCYSATD